MPDSRARAWPGGHSASARCRSCPLVPSGTSVCAGDVWGASRNPVLVPASPREPWGAVTVRPLPRGSRASGLRAERPPVAGFPGPAPVSAPCAPCPLHPLAPRPRPARLQHPPCSPCRVNTRLSTSLSFPRPESQYHGGRPSVLCPRDREAEVSQSQDCFPHHRSLPHTRDFTLIGLFNPLSSLMQFFILICSKVN